MLFWIGFFAGGFVFSILGCWASAFYHKTLELKAQDGSAECIRGKFYMIVPEEDYVQSSLCLGDGSKAPHRMD